MKSRYEFCISFSGLVVRFEFPERIPLSTEFENLQCENRSEVDAEYEVCLLNEPLKVEEAPLHIHNETMVYRTKNGWLRIYSPLITDDGVQVACFLSNDKKNKLYYPASRWKFYSAPLHCTHLIGGEVLLLMFDAFLLHSSVVQINGKTVLFSGPSGIGKSTQAKLWEEYLGAEILNGDRCVVMKKADGFYGGGSIWAGTSGIYRPEQAPIAGIFLLGQAPENKVHRLGIEAFKPLFSQTIVNSWDSEFMEKILQLYSELLAEIPIYQLDCRADKETVDLAYHTLF